MGTILEYGVVRACERNEHNGNEFTTAHFQNVMAKLTEAQPMMTPQLAEAVLMSIPGVRRGVSRCYWIYDAIPGKG